MIHIDLRRLILMLTIASMLISLANALYASYQVQRQQLIDATLMSNQAYANKLAAVTEDFFDSATQQLAYAAQMVARDFSNRHVLAAEAKRLLRQTDSFNSIAILDRQAEVLAISPHALNLVGQQLQTPGALEMVNSRKPLISQPYLSTIGNLLISISHPVFSADGRYLGAVAGTIYLGQKSILNRLLGAHYYQDGSTLYVVDQQRRLIYHSSTNRVGSAVMDNEVIECAIAGTTGKQQVVNSEGTPMLAGYAAVPVSGWGIVAQRPLHATLAPMDALMTKVLVNSLPVAALLLLLIWWCARRVSQPLRQLADGARAMDNPATATHIQGVRSWYFESSELKKALLLGIGLLQKNISKLREDVQTDPLTGLGNRRTLEHFLRSWEREPQPFSVMAVDVDHFKRINDTHGHDAGDEVLKQLARHMRECARDDDVFCRVGGEEFLIILPKTGPAVAQQVAERLRQQVESADMAPVGKVTISIGIASWPASSTDAAAVLKGADDMLYQAKRKGRNRVEVH